MTDFLKKYIYTIQHEVTILHVYLDIIILENFIMDYILLYSTGIILKKKIKHTMIVISAMCGAVYVAIIYVTKALWMNNFVIKIVMSFAMVKIAFENKKIKKSMVDLIFFYLVSFVYSGCTLAFMYILNVKSINMSILHHLILLISASCISYFIIRSVFNIYKKKAEISEHYCNIDIFINEQHKQLRALIDSGNFLKDPISKDSVIVVEYNEIQEILSEDIKKIMMKKLDDIKDNDINIRFIPFKSLGNENGYLLGIKPTKIIIRNEDKEIEVKKVIIGLYDKKIGTNSMYQSIIGTNLIKENL